MLTTDRLRIRLFCESDYDFIVELFNSPGWIEFIGDRNVRNELAARDYIKSIILESYQKHEFGPYAVESRETGKLVGMSGFLKRDYLEFPDLGFAYLPNESSKGYAVEAASALVSYGFSELKLPTIFSITESRNVRALNMLNKLGFSRFPYKDTNHHEDTIFRCDSPYTILTTSRLILRHLSVYDVDFIIELVNTPDWIKFIGDRNIHTTEDAKAYILNGPLQSYQTYGYGLSLILLKDCFTPIGLCGCLNRDYLSSPDLGYALLPSYYKQGYALEICRAVLENVSNTHHITKVHAITLPTNISSVNLLHKLQFEIESTCWKYPSGGDNELVLFTRDMSS